MSKEQGYVFFEKGYFMDAHDRLAIFGSARIVVNFIKKVHEDRWRVEHVCVNYAKYRVELR